MEIKFSLTSRLVIGDAGDLARSRVVDLE